MKPRGLIALFIVAAIISPCAAYAQKGALPTIGYLGFDSAEKSKELLVAFRDGLRTKGFVEGQNVAIEYDSLMENMIAFRN
jgi:putative ABC transport system substrate-binding protein